MDPAPRRRTVCAIFCWRSPATARRIWRPASPSGTDPLLFYSGLFAAHPRSADRLGAILSDWLGQRVEVEQFAGAWLPLGRAQMSALPTGDRPGNFNCLGVDAAIGDRAWDVQSRIVLRIGPLDLARFEALLPDRSVLIRLAALVRAFLGLETTFAVNPVLAAEAVPLWKCPAPLRPAWVGTAGCRCPARAVRTPTKPCSRQS
ncbi:MAG: type VI secretion system baseplate subunit TssG [Aliidongia sp.]